MIEDYVVVILCGVLVIVVCAVLCTIELYTHVCSRMLRIATALEKIADRKEKE